MINNIYKTFVFSIVLVLICGFSCNKSDSNSANNPYKVSVDENTYFKINIGGKQLVTYGLQFGIQTYEALVFTFSRGSVTTRTISGQIESQLILMVNPLYKNMFGDYGIKDGEVQTILTASRVGEGIGAYSFSNYDMKQITDLSLANKIYDIDASKSTLSVTSIDSKYIKGNFNLALINGSGIIMSPGSFSIPKF